MTLTLRTRLTAVYTAVFGVLLGAESALAYRTLAHQLEEDATTHVTALAQGLHGFVRFPADGASITFDGGDPGEAAFVREATENCRILDTATGRVLFESAGFQQPGLHDAPWSGAGAGAAVDAVDVVTPRGRFRVANSTGVRPTGRAYLLQVAVPLADMDAALHRYLEQVAWQVPLALLIAAFASWWMARFALAPLARLAAGATAIDIGRVDSRLPLRGAADELDEVTRAFNDTIGRLAHAVADLRQFSTALAHDLRTPLAALRGEIELDLGRSQADPVRREAAESQLEEIDKLTRLIDQVLTIARARAGEIAIVRSRLDLGALAAGLVELLEPIADARGVALACTAGGPVPVAGDATWLERLVLNLVDNALKFTDPGGRVDVEVGHAHGEAVLSVRDTGPGMPDEVARRFAPPAGGGALRAATHGPGLGLSLVKWIVDAHGGRIDVATRAGAGTTVTVRLIAASPLPH